MIKGFLSFHVPISDFTCNFTLSRLLPTYRAE